MNADMNGEVVAATEELVALLTKQAREGDEAVAALARVRALAARSIGHSCHFREQLLDILRALDVTSGAPSGDPPSR